MRKAYGMADVSPEIATQGNGEPRGRERTPALRAVVVCADLVTRRLPQMEFKAGEWLAVPSGKMGRGLVVQMRRGSDAGSVLSVSYEDVLLIQAIGTLYEAGITHVTLNEVCKCLLGCWNLSHAYPVPSSFRAATARAIARLREMVLAIDANRQATHGKTQGGAGGFEWEGALLDVADCKFTARNGAFVDGYRIDGVGVLVEYARDRGHLEFAPIKAVTLPRTSCLRRRMQNYLLTECRRIKGHCGELLEDGETKRGRVLVASMLKAIGGGPASPNKGRYYRTIHDGLACVCAALESGGLLSHYEIEGKGDKMKVSLDVPLKTDLDKEKEVKRQEKKARRRRRLKEAAKDDH